MRGGTGASFAAAVSTVAFVLAVAPPASAEVVELAVGGIVVEVPEAWTVVEQREEALYLSDGAGTWVFVEGLVRPVGTEAAAVLTEVFDRYVPPETHGHLVRSDVSEAPITGRVTSAAAVAYGATLVDDQGSAEVEGQIFAYVRDDGVVLLMNPIALPAGVLADQTWAAVVGPTLTSFARPLDEQDATLFVGGTEAENEVRFTVVEGDERRVQGLRTHISYYCVGGVVPGQFSSTDIELAESFPIASDGTFSGEERFASGFIFQVQGTFQEASRASGTFLLTYPPDGCNSGHVDWDATAVPA